MTSFIKRRIVTSETLGERLKKIREGRGLGLDDIEAETNIKVDYILALEEGDYNSLPGEIYVKSFLKVYGSFLGLEEDEIVEQYEKERRVDEHRVVARHAAGGRDLFGRRVDKGHGFRGAQQGKISFRNIVLSQIFVKGMAVLLILAVLFYLGFGVRKILRPPSLTVLTPADNLIIQEALVEVLGVVENGSELKINDNEVIYDERGVFREMIDLREGLNEIRVVAKKQHSRETTVVRRIMVE